MIKKYIPIKMKRVSDVELFIYSRWNVYEDFFQRFPKIFNKTNKMQVIA